MASGTVRATGVQSASDVTVRHRRYPTTPDLPPEDGAVHPHARPYRGKMRWRTTRRNFMSCDCTCTGGHTPLSGARQFRPRDNDGFVAASERVGGLQRDRYAVFHHPNVEQFGPVASRDRSDGAATTLPPSRMRDCGRGGRRSGGPAAVPVKAGAYRLNRCELLHRSRRSPAADDR